MFFSQFVLLSHPPPCCGALPREPLSQATGASYVWHAPHKLYVPHNDLVLHWSSVRLSLVVVVGVFRAKVPFTLFLHCPKEELKKRLLERGETSGRADDNVETVLKRFDTFEKESLPVVEHLDRLGMVS